MGVFTHILLEVTQRDTEPRLIMIEATLLKDTLICRADIYLQWLEGPEAQVRKALERIAHDDRHLEVKVHVAEPVAERAFGEWAMLHDPAATWIWTQTEVADGAVDRASPEEVTGFFLRLSGAAAAYGDG
jgi:hypothetical protein